MRESSVREEVADRDERAVDPARVHVEVRDEAQPVQPRRQDAARVQVRQQLRGARGRRAL
jgi:hypothetical protein